MSNNTSSVYENDSVTEMQQVSDISRDEIIRLIRNIESISIDGKVIYINKDGDLGE